MTTEPHHDIHEQWRESLSSVHTVIQGWAIPFVEASKTIRSLILCSACLIEQLLGEANSEHAWNHLN